MFKPRLRGETGLGPAGQALGCGAGAARRPVAAQRGKLSPGAAGAGREPPGGVGEGAGQRAGKAEPPRRSTGERCHVEEKMGGGGVFGVSAYSCDRLRCRL